MGETAHDPKYLLDIIDRQNQMIEKLLAENDEYRALGLDLDAHSCLKAVYSNHKASETNRVKAASAAIGYELPKPGPHATVATQLQASKFLAKSIW
jgi:hypothetical protein